MYFYGGTQRPPSQKLTPLFPHKLTPLFPREFTGKEWSQFLGRWPLCTTVIFPQQRELILLHFLFP